MGSDTLYVEGLKGYVKVHFTSLRSREDKLPADKLMRLRRSGIAGLDHVGRRGLRHLAGTRRNAAQQRRLPRGRGRLFYPLEVGIKLFLGARRVM